MAKRLWLSDEELSSLDKSELQALVARHQRIFHASSGYGFWDWNLSNNEFDWSGEFWQQLGWVDEDADFINDSFHMVKLIHPEDLPDTKQALIEHLKTGKHFNRSFRVKTKEGKYRWSQCLCDSVRDETGRVQYVSGINFDITAFKETEEAMRQSEERQRRIINGANDGIWEWSLLEKTFYFSPKIFEMINVSISPSDLADGEKAFEKFRSRVHPDDIEEYDFSWRSHIKSKSTLDIEYRVYGGDNQLYWVRTRGQATFNKEGWATLISGTNSDVTDRKLAEEKVLRSKEIAEKANQAKSQFLSSMSHELRTPLNAILGFSQLFDYENNLTERQHQNVNEIRKAGEHLLKLINDILDLAKIESGKMTLSLEPVLPVRILRECMGLVQSIAETRNIRVDFETNDLDKIYVHADAVRLKQVLLNLMSNGIKYNRDAGRLSIVFTSPDEQTINIKVEDTGFGIPDAQKKYVFEPFNRLGAEESATEGSGVGLVITKQLVEIMGGSIRFTSEVGKGSCFEVSLQKSEEWTAEKAKAPLQDRANQTLQLELNAKQKILYIEDNASNLRLMEQLLGRFEQIELLTVNEAFRGLYVARTEHPDLIILDINLPGMDGYEALKVLQQDPNTQGIPVIALSANAMKHDVKRGLEAGFDDYLTKPVVYAELIAVLNKLLADEVDA